MNASWRKRILAEWRGLPESAPGKDRAQPVSTVLEKVMRNLGLAERLTESQVRGAWRQIVGEFIAQHSSPVFLRDGVLYVQVLQPTVHYELDRVWKPQIVKKLKAEFGAKVIRDVRFRVG